MEEQEGALWGWYQGDVWHSCFQALNIFRLFSGIATTPCWQWLCVCISEVVLSNVQTAAAGIADAAPGAACNAHSKC